MNVCSTITWCVIVCITCNVDGKNTEEDVGSVDYTNASMYTTSEMRDKVLEEWKGRTNEIQGYFDQLPSEEFKENSEDLKFKYYYERKGVKDIDTNQVFNITTQQYHEPRGPMYTIEVNDSYVPKYRITPSEEERMDKYGTFNSKSESENSSEEVKRKKKKKKKKDSSESEGEKDKKKKEKKTWPSNMDPKERRKKKKSKTTEDEKKRKDLAEKTMNGVNHIRVNLRKIQEGNIPLRNPNQKHAGHSNLQNNNQGNKMNREYHEKDVQSRKENYKIKESRLHPNQNNKSIEMKVKKENKLGTINNEEIENRIDKFEKHRKRSKLSVNAYPVRPFVK